jgi:serine/threonine protein kinase
MSNNNDSSYRRRPLTESRSAQLRDIPNQPLGPADPDRSGEIVARYTQDPRADLAELAVGGWYTLYRRWGAEDGAAIKGLTTAFIAALTREAGPPLRVAKGAFGKVLVVRNTPAVRAVLDRLRAKALKSGNFVPGEPINGFSPAIAIKVQPIYRTSYYSTIGNRLREDAVHAYLTLAGCRTGPDGERWCARDAVPALHWAGYLVRDNVQLSVMEAVEGPELFDEMTRQSRAGLRGLLAQLERATFTLWAFGVFHGDLHEGNAIVQPDGRIKIIDFGFASVLDELRPAGPPLRLSEFRSARLHERLESAVDEIMRWRGYWVGYNPNTTELRRFWESARPTTPNAPNVSAPRTGRSFQSGNLPSTTPSTTPSLRAPRPASAQTAAANLVELAASLVVGSREEVGYGKTGRMESEVTRSDDDYEYGRVVATASAKDDAWSVRVIAFASNGPHRADLTLSGTTRDQVLRLAPGASATSVKLARAILAKLRAGAVRGSRIGASAAWCLAGAGAPGCAPDSPAYGA